MKPRVEKTYATFLLGERPKDGYWLVTYDPYYWPLCSVAFDTWEEALEFAIEEAARMQRLSC